MQPIVRIRLKEVDERATIKIESSDGKVAEGIFRMPWLDPEEWETVFQSLDALINSDNTWPKSPDLIRRACELELIREDGSPLGSRTKVLGRELYDVAFAKEKIRQVLRDALNSCGEQIPVVAFRFHALGTYVQTYPWEILCDSEDFLFDSNRASLVRYVDYDKPVQPISLSTRLSVLIVDPRPPMPDGYQDLPRKLDREILENHLPDTLRHKVSLHDLRSVSTRSSTFSQIGDALDLNSNMHVIHIDAHGEFGRLCELCGTLNSHSSESCCECGAEPLTPPQGYLAFQKDGDLTWIDGTTLGKRIAKNNVMLVVLSACDSGLVGGGSVFNSVAGALVGQGIPAVVGMQFIVAVDETKTFVYSLYKALLSDKSLTEAMAIARSELLEFPDAWYRPVLYLRTDESNLEGRILRPTGLGRRKGYRWDVFLSHPLDEKWEHFIYGNEMFLHQLKINLEEWRGEARIFVPRPDMSLEERREGLLHSRCLVALCSVNYFRRDRRFYDLAVMLQREQRLNRTLVHLVSIFDGDVFFPQVLKKKRIADLREYTGLPEGVRTEKRSEFENKVENWVSKQVARTVSIAPPWNHSFHQDLDLDQSLLESLLVTDEAIQTIFTDSPTWDRRIWARS